MRLAARCPDLARSRGARVRSTVVDSIEQRLALEPVDGDSDTFLSVGRTDPRHVYGGLLVAQALRAAQLTVDDGRLAHSLHASFVRAGTGGERLRHEVERTRDGSSFATRRVVVRQDAGVVMVLTADFHHEEPGLEYEPPANLDIPGPDEVEAAQRQSKVFENRPVPVESIRGALPHTRCTWVRPRGGVLPDDPALHLQVLAYLSDHGPSRAARAPHADVPRESIAQPVSLDHSIWFHRPVDANDWLLFELVPVATGRGRGLSFGTVRTRDRVLVASVAQEILLRPKL